MENRKNILNPYEQLPEQAFWRPSVGSRSPFDINNLWQPKFPLNPAGKWVTFGSCFAQHLSKALVEGGFSWKNYERAPAGVIPDVAKRYNYGVYSARTGNIYTTTLLLQWMKWALGEEKMPEEVWEQNGRYMDPFRPAIEPNGFATFDELMASRRVTLDAFRRCMTDSSYFVFTLGLTESWHHADGYEYPMCPGTVGGTFDATRHSFRNMNYNEVYSGLARAIALLRKANRNVKILLTVSPVPLTATMSGQHVLVATMHSKSVLRAVAGYLQGRSPYIDYMPSYEIINSSPFKGMFFEPNMRGVNPCGVRFVMDEFFRGAGLTTPVSHSLVDRVEPRSVASSESEQDPVCEEEMLGAFG